jgi:hypothetical protein
MIVRRSAAAAACAAALALAACGGSDAPARPGGKGQAPDPNDKRAVALDCITNKQQVPAALVGEKAIQVGQAGGPRIEFLISGGEAEGRQFQGDAQGAEQIGSTLLFLNDGSDDQIKKIEKCLDDQ